jgi:hypothetical protein
MPFPHKQQILAGHLIVVQGDISHKYQEKRRDVGHKYL